MIAAVYGFRERFRSRGQLALCKEQGERSVKSRAGQRGWCGPASVCDRPLGGTSSTSHCLYGIGTSDVESPSSSTHLYLFKLYSERKAKSNFQNLVGV